MGMYDVVDITDIECWNCHYKIPQFQTKDTDCTMSWVEFWKADNFYAACDNCGAWNEYQYPSDELKKNRKFEDYQLIKEF